MFTLAIFLLFQVPITGFNNVAFTHDGINTTHYEMQIDADPPRTVTVTPLVSVPGDFTTPLPLMPVGDHTLKILACNAIGCVASDPLLLRVLPMPTKPTNPRLSI